MEAGKTRPRWFWFVMFVGVPSALFSLVALLSIVGAVFEPSSSAMPRAVVDFYAAGFFLGGLWVLAGPLLIVPAVVATVRASSRPDADPQSVRRMAVCAGMGIFSWSMLMMAWRSIS